MAARIGATSVALDGVAEPGAGGAAATDGPGVATTASEASADLDGAADKDGAAEVVGLATAGVGGVIGVAVGRAVGFAVGPTVGRGVVEAALTTIVPNICSGCTWQK